MTESCLRCGAAMEWRHQTWQCPRCRFKIGCCEGDSCEALDSAGAGTPRRVSRGKDDAMLVAFAYAFEHLEIAGYEQLRRVAEQAGDGETADVAARILEQERNAAEKLAASFDRAVEASLRAQGVTA